MTLKKPIGIRPVEKSLPLPNPPLSRGRKPAFFVPPFARRDSAAETWTFARSLILFWSFGLMSQLNMIL